MDVSILFWISLCVHPGGPSSLWFARQWGCAMTIITRSIKLLAKGAEWEHFWNLRCGGFLTEQQGEGWKKWITGYIAGSTGKTLIQLDDGTIKVVYMDGHKAERSASSTSNKEQMTSTGYATRPRGTIYDLPDMTAGTNNAWVVMLGGPSSHA